MEMMKRLWNEEEGQGMVEYGLIIALIAVVIVVALGPLGETVRDIFDGITEDLGGTGSGAGSEG